MAILMIDGFFKLILSLFLDKEARDIFARRSQTFQLANELRLERAKTNALVTALNRQGDQNFSISDERLAKIASALDARAGKKRVSQ